jgi:hypothetical protein
MHRKLAISAFANALNIVIGMIPAFFAIPYIAKNFGNYGVAYWNLFLAYVSIYLLIADYGYNEDASKKIQSDNKNIIKIGKIKIYTAFAASVLIFVFYIFDVASDVNPFCLIFAVVSYAFNPIYYYQAKNKSEIPLLVNSLTVFAYVLAILFIRNLNPEHLMYLFATRVAVMNMILWFILAKEMSFNVTAYVDVVINSLSDELKNNFSKFFYSIGAAFLNSGYIILASMQLEKSLFAQYTMIHKLTFVALMFVISYCQTAMLVIKKTKLVILSIVLAGFLYYLLSESFLKFFGIDTQDVKPLLMNLSGALFFVTMGVSTLFYFKILHDGQVEIKKISIYNFITMGSIILSFVLFKIPDYLVIWIPVLYSVSYLLVVLKVYKNF